jgi:hypothetical protein
MRHFLPPTPFVLVGLHGSSEGQVIAAAEGKTMADLLHATYIECSEKTRWECMANLLDAFLVDQRKEAAGSQKSDQMRP